MKQLVSIVSMLFLAACGDEPTWPGQYQLSGQWNLSGPLTDDRTVGDAIADLLVEKIVGASGVPSMFEETVQEIVSDSIRDEIKSLVDENAPAALAPDGDVTRALAASLADVRLESSLELEEGLLPGDLEGTEVVTALEYDHEGTPEHISPGDLFPGAGITMGADWEGEEGDEGELEIDPHGLNIQYGELVARAVSQVVDATGQQELESDVLAAVDCARIVDALLGGQAAFEIGYQEWSVSLSSADLIAACDAARTLIEDRVLGMFALDTRVQVGGLLTYADSDGDGKADTLASAPGFGGILAVAPAPIAPRLSVSFTGTRR
ncbi:MAG: hypothetical protein JXR96_30040 [Deltaproteobacteria bacterium]|nr:hypothetical protein [Deltaproteobacteria bacterium]